MQRAALGHTEPTGDGAELARQALPVDTGEHRRGERHQPGVNTRQVDPVLVNRGDKFPAYIDNPDPGVGLGRYDFQLPVCQVHVRPLEIDDFTPAQARVGGCQGYQVQVLRFGAVAPSPGAETRHKSLKLFRGQALGLGLAMKEAETRLIAARGSGDQD